MMPEYFGFAWDNKLYAQDALYGVSASIKNYWEIVYPLFEKPEGKYGAVPRFVNVQKKFFHLCG